MKPVWLMLLTVCGLSTAANATPDPGAWRREVLLGSNRDSYFVWISTWAQPGSHHSYSASMAVERRSLHDHRAIESHDLVRYSANEFDPAGSWRHTPASLTPFDVASYLRDQGASPSFSEDYAVDVTLRDGALVLIRGDKVATLLARSEVEAQVPVTLADSHAVRVIPACQVASEPHSPPGEATWFYTLQLNTPSWDDNWTEVLIAVPGTRVAQAVK